MRDTQKMVRLQVRITVTAGFEAALERKAASLHLTVKDCIMQALTEWMSKPTVLTSAEGTFYAPPAAMSGVDRARYLEVEPAGGMG
jgi:hypothetical protein